MNFTFGYKCVNQTGVGEGGANIRVQEIFKRCGDVGTWADKPATLKSCLAFITEASNVDISKKTMVNVPKKHIGIFHCNRIVHYSNSKDKVVSQTVDQFQRHYRGKNITIFYGTYPAG